MKRLLLVMVACVASSQVRAQDKFTPEAIEFFEKKVRPVLVEHCFECHSTKLKRPKGGLLLDSRAGMLEGGDLGPAIVPGQPEKSRVIDAISHKNVNLKMPQKYKLPDAVRADLAAWIKMGAPWPDEKLAKKSTYSDFNLAKRKAEHWCWQPIRAGAAPPVKDAAWPSGDVDRFLLAKLEAKGLTPARDADARILLRRLYFDLIGLPPTRDEVEGFVKAWDAAGAKRGEVYAQVVDKLLDSPAFGERWARHWLDLVRYAESRGHEFDYTIPNAYHYRDYVIRAFNSDVPYNQFVKEHIAGDLLTPRLSRPSPPGRGVGSEGTFNESILGTAFWFLGEECHSPVDIRQDQADRFDNRIDVVTKTFLGLTVACARCHDHKFDAISTRDYYALFGILESSNYRLARFDTITQHRAIAQQLRDFRAARGVELLKAQLKTALPSIEKSDWYLLTAAGIEDHSKGLHPELVKRWKLALMAAEKSDASPLHAFARAASEKSRTPQEVFAAILKRWQTPELDLKSLDVVVDYRNSSANQWLPDDAAFGAAPVQPGAIRLGADVSKPVARIVERAAAERDRQWDGLRLSAGTQNESGALGGAQRSGRTLRTPEFTLKHTQAYALVKGSGVVYSGVGQHIMLAGPLHGSLMQKFNSPDKYQWVAVNLAPYKGQRLHLEFTPNDNSDFALIAVVQAPSAPPAFMTSSNRGFATMANHLLDRVPVKKDLKTLAGVYQECLLGVAARIIEQKDGVAAVAEQANWLVQNMDLFIAPGSPEGKKLAEIATPIFEEQKKILAQIKLDSRLTPAMQDGSGADEHVFIRGNPKTPGELVPRRFLEAFAGAQRLPAKTGSGRLELAEQMTNPALTPQITRVYVNRVWHHLFGRGIVASVDNFGVLGEAPTHPELLDFLANQFDKKHGWSTKKLIRTLVLSRAYQMASTPDAKAVDADPDNSLLHRMRIRRLEGEAIRDSILKVSGRLNPAMYGPSIPVHLTPFQDGRGKPASGPLDGDGRRSVYLGARRNFLSSFLLAFDAPSPFSTVGRRTVSNVPAQALILMNDPFVHQQADVWAKRVLAEKASNADRVRGMYLDAFARPPSVAELRTCIDFLGTAPDQRRFADLAHVLYNAKEFYFVN